MAIVKGDGVAIAKGDGVAMAKKIWLGSCEGGELAIAQEMSWQRWRKKINIRDCYTSPICLAP
jgi:hypothetical protein